MKNLRKLLLIVLLGVTSVSNLFSAKADGDEQVLEVACNLCAYQNLAIASACEICGNDLKASGVEEVDAGNDPEENKDSAQAAPADGGKLNHPDGKVTRDDSGEQIACPTCTAFNFFKNSNCEVCEGLLRPQASLVDGGVIALAQGLEKLHLGKNVCPTCTFNNNVTMSMCEMCGTRLKKEQGRTRAPALEAKQQEEKFLSQEDPWHDRLVEHGDFESSIVCNQCTLENPIDSQSCSACGSRFDVGVIDGGVDETYFDTRPTAVELAEEAIDAEITNLPKIFLLNASHINMLPVDAVAIQYRDYEATDADIAALVERCPHLRVLVLLGNKKITDESLCHIAKLAHLQKLTLAYCDGLTTLNSLTDHSALRTLDISGCEKIIDLLPLKTMPKLRSLCLAYCKHLKPFHFMLLSSLKSLRELNLTACTQVTDAELDLVAKIPLRKLNLLGCTRITRLACLESHRTLEEINVGDCSGLKPKYFYGFGSIPRLRRLHIGYNPQLRTLEALQFCYGLEELHIPGCALYNFYGLKNLKKLRFLDLRGSKSIRSFDGIAEIRNLSTFDIGYSTLPDDAVACLQQLSHLQELYVENYGLDKKNIPAALHQKIREPR